MNEPIGRFGSCRPTRLRRMALETAVTASSWPMTRLCSVSSRRSKRCPLSSSVSCATGTPVQHGDNVGDVLHGDLPVHLVCWQSSFHFFSASRALALGVFSSSRSLAARLEVLRTRRRCSFSARSCCSSSSKLACRSSGSGHACGCARATPASSMTSMALSGRIAVLRCSGRTA